MKVHEISKMSWINHHVYDNHLSYSRRQSYWTGSIRFDHIYPFLTCSNPVECQIEQSFVWYFSGKEKVNLMKSQDLKQNQNIYFWGYGRLSRTDGPAEVKTEVRKRKYVYSIPILQH